MPVRQTDISKQLFSPLQSNPPLDRLNPAGTNLYPITQVKYAKVNSSSGRSIFRYQNRLIQTNLPKSGLDSSLATPSSKTLRCKYLHITQDNAKQMNSSKYFLTPFIHLPVFRIRNRFSEIWKSSAWESSPNLRYSKLYCALFTG